MPEIPVLIVIGIIFSLTIYIIVYHIYPSSGNKDLLSELQPLKKKKNIMMPDRVQTELLGSSGSTVMGFFYLKEGDRTMKISKDNSYIPLLQVENNWRLEVIQSGKDKNGYGAQLIIRTQNGSQMKSETLSLPPIPKQKWVYIAILREGRRFDVMYDTRIVASKRLEYYPVVIASPMSIGNEGLDGSAIHINVNSRRLSPSEVNRERSTHVDTNGMVVNVKFNPLHDLEAPEFPILSITAKCPPGLPCDPVTTPPKKGLYEWKSPYA
jgi:hypothetical protein